MSESVVPHPCLAAVWRDRVGILIFTRDRNSNLAALPLHKNVHRFLSRDTPHHRKSSLMKIDPSKQMLPFPQQHRRNR
jgi:hypothetical protein